MVLPRPTSIISRSFLFLIVFLIGGFIVTPVFAIGDTAELRSLNNIARNFLLTNHDSASKYSDLALNLATKISDQKGLANALLNKGGTLSRKGMNQQALLLFFQALAISEKLPDSTIMASAYNWIGSSYLDQRNWELAMKYYSLFLSTSESIGDIRGIGSAYINLGTVFQETKQYEAALKYYTKAYQHSVKFKDLRGEAGALTNIGCSYSALGDYEKALEYQEKGLKLSREIGNKVFECVSLSELGELYYKIGDFDKAISTYQKALDLSNECNYTEGRKSAHKGLVKTYQHQKNYQLAFENLSALSSIKDSLFTEESARSMAEIAAQYETVRKEKTISELKEKTIAQELKSLKKTVILVLIFIIIAAISLFLFLRFKRHQKEISLREVKDATHNERARISRDIHDELGSGLSSLAYMAERSKNPESKREISDEITSISQSATSLIASVGDLVWTINPENGNLDYLVAKIREHINECEEISGMRFELIVPEPLPDFKFQSEAKKNIYLFTKEAVTNSMRHSGGMKVTTRISFSDHEMQIIVQDDGTGFKGAAKAKTRHGMGNMKHRIESLGGHFAISKPVSGEGTIVSASIPLENIFMDESKND